ncbi:charged multivesicular body protein 7 [Prorops nasuta]|uniref:charged multivesicular body protein 7 n=1 Tax=Prorops nasuta TaxID=863751 RepID=UPI0034CD3C15
MAKSQEEERRINALFSPIRNNSVNPQDRRSKYDYWTKRIIDYLKTNAKCTFTLNDLNNAFQRNGSIPHCLPMIIEDLSRCKLIIRENDFLKDPSKSWILWSLDMLIKKPFAYAFLSMKNILIGNVENVDESYIHIEPLKSIANFILSAAESKEHDFLMTVTEILKDCQQNEQYKTITEDTVILAVQWLQYNKKAVICKDSNEKIDKLLIKFSKNTVNDITEFDKAIYKLREEEHKLLKGIQLLNEERNHVIEEAKSSLKNGNRNVARTYVKQKKDLEHRIDNHHQILSNVKSIKAHIQNTEVTSSVYETFKKSSIFIKQLRKDQPTEYDIKDVIEDISEAISEMKETEIEINEAMPNPYTDSDLEEELEMLCSDKITIPETDVKSNSLCETLNINAIKINEQDIPYPITTKSQTTKKIREALLE